MRRARRHARTPRLTVPGNSMSAVDERVRVLGHTVVGDGLHQLRLRACQIVAQAQPGQFVQLRVGANVAPLLRLPLSIARAAPDTGTIELIYAQLGPKTTALAAVPDGAELDCLGPLGNGFRAPPAARSAVLVGGGVGLPPLLFWGRYLRAQRVHTVLLVGARTGAKHLPKDLLLPAADRYALSTDDGTLGHGGWVTELLETELESSSQCTVYSCGPYPMMRVVADCCARRTIPCQVSLEAYMACGIGICAGCVVRVQPTPNSSDYDRYQRVCTQGPVFDAAAIDWQE
jgi:dihydroorotate dehydrogenase electron transfer subunit